MTKCLKCGKSLVSIGKQRLNGKNFLLEKNDNNDWSTREYHKKCWKIKKYNDDMLKLISSGATAEEMMYGMLF
jgi:hypothetical protein